jgi:hypothetical protein
MCLYLSLTVKMSHIFSCNFKCLSNALHSQVYIGNSFDKLFVFIFVQALLSVLCPEQHDALNAFQWTRCQQLQKTPESLRTMHQPIHPRIIPVPPLHQVAQENHRQFPTNIGQADLKNCRKYQSHKLQTQFAQHSSCNYTGGSGMCNQASPELRVLQERNIWGQSYALESSRFSECAGIREPRQGKRDSTQTRPLRTFSSLASIGSRGLKSTFVLQVSLIFIIWSTDFLHKKSSSSRPLSHMSKSNCAGVCLKCWGRCFTNLY